MVRAHAKSSELESTRPNRQRQRHRKKDTNPATIQGHRGSLSMRDERSQKLRGEPSRRPQATESSFETQAQPSSQTRVPEWPPPQGNLWNWPSSQIGDTRRQ